MWHPLGSAQRHSQVRQKQEPKKQSYFVQEHDYYLRGFEVTGNFFLCESPQHDLAFLSVLFSFFLVKERVVLFVFYLPEFPCISTLY